MKKSCFYISETRFNYITSFDERNGRAVSYQIPNLPEIDCLDERSELCGDGSIIRKGILCSGRIGENSIFRLKGAKGHYIMASLAFVESAYRREVRGMGIEEFVVR